MDKEKLSKLYELCKINSKSKEYKDLVHEFCDNEYSILSNIDDLKLEIIKHLISNVNVSSDDEVLTLLDCLKYYLDKICFRLTRLDEIELKDIDAIIYQLHVYESIQSILLSFELDECSEYSKLSIESYLNSEIYFMYSEVLLHYLQNEFLDLDEKRINYIRSLIIHNKKFKKLVSNGKLNDLELNVVLTYVGTMVPIMEFVSELAIQMDPIVSSIVSFNIDDKRVIKEFILVLSLRRLLSIFGSLHVLLDFINHCKFLKSNEKDVLFRNIVNKAMNEGMLEELVKYIIYVSNSDKKLTMVNESDVLSKVLKGGVINFEVINYLSDKDIDDNFVANSIFATKDMALIQKFIKNGYIKRSDFETKINSKDTLEEKICKCHDYNMTGRVISSIDAEEMLQAYFLGNAVLNLNAMQAIIRSVVLQSSNSLNALLFVNSSRDYKEQVLNNIFINNKLVLQFLDDGLPWSKRINVFRDCFYEVGHTLQSDSSMNVFMEYSLRKYDADYNLRNYDVTEIERDACVYGDYQAWKFLRRFTLPFDISFLLDEKSKNNDDRAGAKKQVSVVKAFQKLVAFHPELALELEKYNKELKEGIRR